MSEINNWIKNQVDVLNRKPKKGPKKIKQWTTQDWRTVFKYDNGDYECNGTTYPSLHELQKVIGKADPREGKQWE